MRCRRGRLDDPSLEPWGVHANFFLSFLKKRPNFCIDRNEILLFLCHYSISLLEESIEGNSWGGGGKGKWERSEKFQSVCAWQIVETRRGFFFFPLPGSPVRTCISATALSGLRA